jgi:hypothetical protein
MELIAAVLLAGPLGYLTRRARHYLIAWAVIFPVQTAVVWNDATGDDGPWAYFAVNAAILALGIGLNRLGRRLSPAGRAERSGAGPDANEPAPTRASAA